MVIYKLYSLSAIPWTLISVFCFFNLSVIPLVYINPEVILSLGLHHFISYYYKCSLRNQDDNINK